MDRKAGVQVVSNKSYLYSVVKPKHLRQSLQEPPRTCEGGRDAGAGRGSERSAPPKPRRNSLRQNSASDCGTSSASSRSSSSETLHRTDTESGRQGAFPGCSHTGSLTLVDRTSRGEEGRVTRTSREEEERVKSSRTVDLQVLALGSSYERQEKGHNCTISQEGRGIVKSSDERSRPTKAAAHTFPAGKLKTHFANCEKIDWCPLVLKQTAVSRSSSRVAEHCLESLAKGGPEAVKVAVNETAMCVEEGQILAYTAAHSPDDTLRDLVSVGATPSSSSSNTMRGSEAGDKMLSLPSLGEDKHETDTELTECLAPEPSGTLPTKGESSLSRQTQSPVPADDVLVWELDNIDVLQTCVFCQRPCSDLKILFCFHMLCSDCAAPVDSDGTSVIICRLCNQSHCLSGEGATAVKDLYPGLLKQCGFLSQGTTKRAMPTEEGGGQERQTDETEGNVAPASDGQDHSVAAAGSEQDGETGAESVSEQNESAEYSQTDRGENIEERMCGACQANTEPDFLCVICGVLMCKACCTAHGNLPVTRHHEVVQVTSVGLSPLKLLQRFQPSCSVHGQDLSFACVTCGVFACHRCLTPAHLQHQVLNLSSLRQGKKKACSVLQRSLKQHALTVKSTRRVLEERLARTSSCCRELCDSIQACASRCMDRIAVRASELRTSVQLGLRCREEQLEKELLLLAQAERDGHRLRCVLGAVTGETPHLTSLVLLHACQAKFEALQQQQRLLHCEEADCLVFCRNPRLEAEVAGESLGSVRHVRHALSENVIDIVRVFHIESNVTGLGVTPHGELVCISDARGTCQVWDRQGALLVDASRHVTHPKQVGVAPDGVIVVLDVACDKGGGNLPNSACLKFLSPAGSFLSQTALTCDPDLTWIHVPDETRVLISDGVRGMVTLLGLDRKDRTLTRALQTVQHDPLLKCPRHVTMTVTEDWVVSDGGATLRLISPGGQVSTLLTEDEPVTALAMPLRDPENDACGVQRALTDVCSDRQGRVVAADRSKCGLYIVTGRSDAEGERHFVSLRGTAGSAHARLAAMTVCCRQGLIYVAMETGQVKVLRLGNGCNDSDDSGDSYVDLRV